jgi:hypothetical protein
LLAHGRWFSPGTPASSTTKTGRHDIAEILLKVALNTINQSNQTRKRLVYYYQDVENFMGKIEVVSFVIETGRMMTIVSASTVPINWFE